MKSQSQEANNPITFTNDTVIVQVPVRLSGEEAVTFKQTCHDLILTSDSVKRIVIAFEQTTFMDSSGLGALVGSYRTAQEKHIGFTLCNITPQVMAVLKLTGLDEVLPIEANLETPPITDQELDDALPTTHKSINSWMKRLIDIIGAIVGLILTAILSIPIAIAITIDDPGPIFFAQTRCGWMGKEFKMWKFRSMCVDAEAKKAELVARNQVKGAFFKIDNDPRITRVGRFLRRTSLDELPQFWNVLIGEMSLVGTRPPTPDEVSTYEVPEWQRLDVKPGMTGEWQVNGRSTIRSFEDVISLDLQYQKNWNLLYDLKLIFKTIGILFNKNSGAV